MLGQLARLSALTSQKKKLNIARRELQKEEMKISNSCQQTWKTFPCLKTWSMSSFQMELSASPQIRKRHSAKFWECSSPGVEWLSALAQSRLICSQASTGQCACRCLRTSPQLSHSAPNLDLKMSKSMTQTRSCNSTYRETNRRRMRQQPQIKLAKMEIKLQRKRMTQMRRREPKARFMLALPNLRTYRTTTWMISVLGSLFMEQSLPNEISIKNWNKFYSPTNSLPN